MALYIGDTLISGTVEGQQLNLPFSLFEYQFTDHVLNNASWLRADTFSWQSGAVYVSAYGKLVEEYATGTTQTEDGITYKLTTNGFKIALPDQETAIASLYASTGKAWYYILDTENERFKLPRGLHGTVVQSYQNGTDWYRIYSDGWCEQGGRGIHSANNQVVTLLKTMGNTNYSVFVQWIAKNYGTYFSLVPSDLTTSNFIISSYTQADSITFQWKACGYISGNFNDMEKYLYFYVGETVSNANLIDAGAVTDFVSSLQEVHCVIETYINGTSWYRVYDDGWCEQGGVVSSVDYYNPKTISFAKTFSDTNYCLSITCKTNSNQVLNANTTLQAYNYSGSQATVFNVSSSSINAYWRACGYLADGEY